VAPKASAEPAVASVAQLAAAPSETPTAPKASAEPAAVPEPPKPPSAPVPQVAEPPRQPLTRAPIAAARSSLREAPVARASAETNDEDRYRARAQSILATALPRASEQARAQIARVLWLAAGAQRQADESFVVEAVARTGAGDPTLFSHDWAPADGRRLHEAARRAYWSRGQLAEALDLELRAFGANPNDAEIASELALLYLRVTPAEAERARGLALHAIRLQAGRPAGSARVEPWLTFAVASALTGRVSDATQALYVALALAPSVERVCRAAQGALSAYGERVREPVEATLYRLRMQGRDEASPYCALPAGLVQRYRYQ
jgi:tetratricopeptide (TPR) repeat protein